MKDSRIQKLVKEGLLDMFRKSKEETPERKYLYVNQLPMNAKAEDFQRLNPDDVEKNLKAFEDAWYRGNKETKDSLRTLLDTEPYSQKKEFVANFDKEMAQYQDDIKTGKVKRLPFSSTVGGGSIDSSTGSSSSRIAGMSGLFEEQLRMQMLAGLITETEYREKLGEGRFFADTLPIGTQIVYKDKNATIIKHLFEPYKEVLYTIEYEDGNQDQVLGNDPNIITK
jgi:hypothetical protein